MRYFLYLFDKRPEYGIFASIGGAIPSFFDDVVVILQACSLTLGITIGVITLILQIRKLKNKE